MELIFIFGLTATEITVSQKLTKRTGYKLFHKHLVVDLLLATPDFGSDSFVALREQIWLSAFDRACQDQVAGLIFTFILRVGSTDMRRFRPRLTRACVEKIDASVWCPFPAT